MSTGVCKSVLIRRLCLAGAGTFAAGADFDPNGRSGNEILCFCVAFTTEVSKYSSITADSMTAEIGVSQQTLEYCRSFLGTSPATTHPPQTLLKPTITEAAAAAISLVCYAEAMIDFITGKDGGIREQRIAISGSGKLALATAFRAIERGATVISLSDRKGSIVQSAGITFEQINTIKSSKSNQASLGSIMRSSFSKYEMVYYPGVQPWQHVPSANIAFPCAIENEMSLVDAKSLAEANLTYVLEGSIMSCTPEAVALFEKCRSEGQGKVWYAPS